MAVKKETEVITIPAIDIRTATITIKGDSPLIVHKWSEKAKKMMLDKQMKVATTKGPVSYTHLTLPTKLEV